MPFVKLRSGAYVDCTGEQPTIIGELQLSDISIALFSQPRFAGQCHQALSIGEHSMLCLDVAEIMGLSRETQIATLMHDAHEAIIGDIPGPLKQFVPGIKTLEAQLQSVIENALDIPTPSPETKKVIKRIDIASLIAEVKYMGLWDHDWARAWGYGISQFERETAIAMDNIQRAGWSHSGEFEDRFAELIVNCDRL